MVMSSLLNYVGNKAKIVEQITKYFPQVSGTFYDCFAGSCVVGLSVDQPRVKFVEQNPYLSQLYRDLTDPNFHTQLTNIITQYGLTNSSVTPRSQYLRDPNIGTVQWMGETIPNLHLDQLNKGGYQQLISDFNSSKFKGVDQSAAYMIATIYGRNSSVTTNPDGTLTGSVGPLDFSMKCNKKLEEHILRIGSGNYQFITGSYDTIQPQPNDFCYFDPPYLASSYRYGGWQESDEHKLLEFIDNLPCPWALSNTLQSGKKRNEILAEWAQDKHVIPIDKQYRKWAGSGRDTHKTPTKINQEVLILSFQPQIVDPFAQLFE